MKKTIEEIATEYAELTIGKWVTRFWSTKEGFKAGVEFAQRWIPIERDKDGFSLDDQEIEMNENAPFLVKDKDGNIELWYENDKTIRPRYTHWKPIEY